MIEEAHWQRGRELREVGGVRWDGVVRWGGRREEGEGEDGIVCESLDDFCFERDVLRVREKGELMCGAVFRD